MFTAKNNHGHSTDTQQAYFRRGARKDNLEGKNAFRGHDSGLRDEKNARENAAFQQFSK